jgi:hypothetical protein
MPQGYDLGPVAGDLLSNASPESEPEAHVTAIPGTPFWVKVFAAIALALLLVFAALHISGRGLGGHMRTPPDASQSVR